MINRKTILAMMFIILFSVEVPGQESRQREALQGLKMVDVAVDLTGDARSLVSSGQLRTDVVLMLRRNGITISGNATPFWNRLHIVIAAIEDVTVSGKALRFSVSTEVELLEVVSLERDPGILTFASTWDTGGINTFPNKNSAAQGLRKQVRDYVDQFSNDYLAMNPITR